MVNLTNQDLVKLIWVSTADQPRPQWVFAVDNVSLVCPGLYSTVVRTIHPRFDHSSLVFQPWCHSPSLVHSRSPRWLVLVSIVDFVSRPWTAFVRGSCLRYDPFFWLLTCLLVQIPQTSIWTTSNLKTHKCNAVQHK